MRLVPARRTGPRPAPTIPPPPSTEGSATAADITAASGAIARMVPRLGVPDVAAVPGPDVALIVDPSAIPVARVYEQVLPEAAAALGGGLSTPADLKRRRTQLGEMLKLHVSAEHLQARIAGTWQVLGAAQQTLVTRLCKKVRALLADERVPAGERERLAQDAAELLRLEEQQRTARAQRRKKTQLRNARTAERLEELSRQKTLLRTMDDLQAGKEVAPEEAAEAVAAYDELAGEERGQER